MLSGVFYACCHPDRVADQCRCTFHRKVRVAQSVTEGIPGLNRKGIKIAVAHKDVLAVIFPFHVIIEIAVFHRVRNILVFHRPGRSQMTGGRHIAEKNIGKGVTAGRAQHGHEQGRVRPGVVQCTDIHHTARVDDQNQFAVSPPA